MFGLTKQVFIVLVSFKRSLPTKSIFSNNEPCVARPT